jgi:cytochrome c biogenesis protein CcdA/thiol-disulfide isomerase/thioredoxin
MLLDVLNIILGFFEGFALILSPCILPILPIILAGSLTGSRRRPLGITAGFVIIFALSAFFSRYLIQHIAIDLNYLRDISYGVLVMLGVIMLSTRLTEKISLLVQSIVRFMPSPTHQYLLQDGLVSGFFFGGLVAIVWTPCAGPILAAVIVQVVIQKSTFMSFLTLIAFGFGAALPMLLIALYGKQLMQTFHFFKAKSVHLRKLLGLIIIVSVLYMLYQERLGTLSFTETNTSIKTATELQNGLWKPYSAPVIAGIDTWINTEPMQISNLKDTVVLVDFWTFSCINCIRTLPYLKMLYKKYHQDGFIIIGVHAPEFAFEKNVANVARAVKFYGIKYPIALDNQFITWRNFNNHYWPAQYLINKQGRVVYEHFGEGDEDVLENNIRFLLGIKSFAMTPDLSPHAYSLRETPETYLGYARAERYVGLPSIEHDKTIEYTSSGLLPKDAWSLQGTWHVGPDKILASKINAAVSIHFHARHVYAVMGCASGKTIRVSIVLNGQNKQVIEIKQQSLYEILALSHVEDGILQITAESPGLEIYTFTFGS